MTGTTRSAFLPRTVVLLGAISLLNDVAGEMLAPYMPIFLTATLGAGPAAVGFIEGLALATASVLKLVAGRLHDAGWHAKPMMLSGYGLSNTVRPLIGFATGWPLVMALRFLDRVGKGIRGTPRDALLASSVPATLRGRTFGFHRAMDHTGAMLGPIVASVLLVSGLGLRDLFFVSAIPGALLMLLILFGLPGRRTESQRPATPVVASDAGTGKQLRWRELDPAVRRLLIASAVLALATMPDALLVLWAVDSGVSLVNVGLVWAVGHAARAAVAGIGGELSDRFGRLPVVLSGWLSRIGLLAVLSQWQGTGFTVWLLFLAYFATTAWSEPAEAALLGDRAPRAQRGTVLGLYHMLRGLMALPGGLTLGLLWQVFDKSLAFIAAAAMTALATAMLALHRAPASNP